jgi:hypothetical protein
MVGSVVVGGGTPAFAGELTAPLRLLDTRASECSDNVVVRYAVG